MLEKDFYLKIRFAIVGITSIISLALFFSIPANAQTNTTPPDGGLQACGSDQIVCLNSIVQNTYQLLVRLNDVPEQLKNVSTMALSWVAKDDSKSTSEIQGNFATLGSSINAINDAQLNMQKQLAIDIFAGGDANKFTTPNPQNPTILLTIPYLNDLAYSSVLGQPLIPKAANVNQAPYNYIKNAAGLNIVHPVPGLGWRGDNDAILKYFNYYKTTMAVSSYDGYVLSNLLAENQNGNVISSTQKNLITQASDSTWIAQIASEELGKVLRQLLMFESQSYVLLTQLVQIERQILTTQVMNNSLQMLNNQTNEQILVPRAQGVQPKG